MQRAGGRDEADSAAQLASHARRNAAPSAEQRPVVAVVAVIACSEQSGPSGVATVPGEAPGAVGEKHLPEPQDCLLIHGHTPRPAKGGAGKEPHLRRRVACAQSVGAADAGEHDTRSQ